MLQSTVIATAMCGAAFAIAPHAAETAAGYPARPITIVVPFGAGAANDLLARSIADVLRERLGPAVVENRPGANTSIGAEAVKRSPPDGHTLLIGGNNMVITKAMVPDLRWDPIADFEPVALTNTLPFFLVVNPEALPVRNAAEMVAEIRKRPGALSYVSPGNGSSHNLAMELFKLETGIDVVHVPYKAMAQGVLDMVSGRTHLTITGYPAVATQVKAGRLKVLAAAGSRRSAIVPDAPTLAESGFPSYAFDSWQGLFAPKGTPRAIVERLNQTINAGLATPALRARLQDQGLEPMAATPEQFADRVATDSAKWRKVIAATGVRPD